MLTLAIDPGNEESAFVELAEGQLHRFGKILNGDLLEQVRRLASATRGRGWHLAVEMVASYGMPVGREVFETCLWIGRFVEAWSAAGGVHTLVYRIDVKTHLCRDSRAKDANIRQALVDRFGPGKERAVGTKRAPGPLYGVSADVWSALAVAVTFADRNLPRERQLP